MNLSIIGSGDWDTSLIEIFDKLCGVHLVYGDPKNSPWTDKGYKLIEDMEQILRDSDVVVIASVQDSRYKHVDEALDHDCHVWVELPFCSNAKDAYQLVKKANDNNLLLFTPHSYEPGENDTLDEVKELRREMAIAFLSYISAYDD